MDNLRRGGEALDQARDPVVEARAQRDDEIGLLEGRHRGDRAVHSRHSQMIRMGIGNGAAPGQRGDRGEVPKLRKLDDRLRGARANGPAPDVQDGSGGSGDEPRGFADLAGVGFDDGVVPGKIRLRSPPLPPAPTW